MPDTTHSDPEGSMQAILLYIAELKGKIRKLPGWGGQFVLAAAIITAVTLMLRFMPPAS